MYQKKQKGIGARGVRGVRDARGARAMRDADARDASHLVNLSLPDFIPHSTSKANRN